jgi:hypothetical protein
LLLLAVLVEVRLLVAVEVPVVLELMYLDIH